LIATSGKADFEKAALTELPLLYRVARRYAMNAAEAEDLVGQTLLAAAKAWANFDGRHVRSWLITILKNEHLKAIRTRSSRPRTIALEDHSSDAADGDIGEEINQRAFVDDILRELDNLPEDFRMAVALCDVEQMSYEDAAASLGIPIGTVRSRLFRGRRALREKLKAWPSDTKAFEATEVGATSK
jgi:RNA polymerase sigma-70 factor (ECF subfamily)